MQINTQILTNDVVSDSDEETGEMTFTGNIYIDVRGATPAEKASIKAILDAQYKEIRSAIYTVGR